MKNNENLSHELATITAEKIVNSYKNVLERLNTEIVKVTLSELGISTENKTPGEVFEEVSALYGNLNEEEQFKLAKKLGGTYHLAKTKAILDTMSDEDIQ